MYRIPPSLGPRHVPSSSNEIDPAGREARLSPVAQPPGGGWAATASRVETPATAAWKEERSALLDRQFIARDIDDRSIKVTLTCAPIEDTLNTLDQWMLGAQPPALLDARQGGPRSIPTRQFIAAYDKFVDDHPLIQAQVVNNLRADPVIKAKLSEHPELEPFFEQEQDCPPTADATRKVILEATSAGCYPQLAAAIYPPLAQAACASTLQPGSMDDRDFQLKYSHERRLDLARLVADSRVVPMQHARDMFRMGQRGQTLQEVLVADEVGRAARDQINVIDGTARLGSTALKHAENTAKLRSLLDRFASRHVDAVRVGPKLLLAQADHDTVNAVHEAIAMTIANAVNNLQGVANPPARNLPQHRFEISSRTSIGRPAAADAADELDAPPAGQSLLRFGMRDRTFSYALELQPDGRSVAVLRKQPLDLLRIPTVLKAWEQWNNSALARDDGSDKTGLQHTMSVLDDFVFGRPLLEQDILAKLRAMPTLRSFFSDGEHDAHDPQAVPSGSSAQAGVRFNESAPAAIRQILERGTRQAIEHRRHVELASIIDRTVIEAACAGAVQAVDADEPKLRGEIKHSIRDTFRDLIHTMELNEPRESEHASEHADNAGAGRSEAPSEKPARGTRADREPRGPLIRDRVDGKLYLAPHIERHAVNTAKLKWMLGRVAPKHISPGSMPLAPLLDELPRGLGETIRETLDRSIDIAIANAVTDVLRGLN